jgi:hypothetical protein
MAAGQDCMECHGSAGGEDARPWSVAGTVAGRQGASVTITDAGGWSFTLRSNQAGNFYTAEGVRFPLRVSVDGKAMPATPVLSQGSCNCCHGGGVGAGDASSTCVPGTGGGGGG